MLNFMETATDTLAIDGNVVKLANKNQIYLDPYGKDYVWVLEMYEGTNDYTGNDEDLFSVFDAFTELEEAISVGSRLTPATYQHLRDQALGMTLYGANSVQ